MTRCSSPRTRSRVGDAEHPSPPSLKWGAGNRGPMPAAPTDHLANERTFLAWVRTAVTIMAFGFVVARFGLLLRELSGTPGSSAGSAPLSEATGVLLVLAGAAVLIVAFLQFLRTRNDLETGNYQVRVPLEWALTILIVIVGAVLAVYLVATG